jgi:hypothetical protein
MEIAENEPDFDVIVKPVEDKATISEAEVVIFIVIADEVLIE